VSGSIVNALNDLGLDYLDLYLINYMRPDWDWDANETKSPATHEVWADMESGVRQGMIKSIGVSNCPVSMLWDMLCYAEIKPSVH